MGAENVIFYLFLVLDFLNKLFKYDHDENKSLVIWTRRNYSSNASHGAPYARAAALYLRLDLLSAPGSCDWPNSSAEKRSPMSPTRACRTSPCNRAARAAAGPHITCRRVGVVRLAELFGRKKVAHVAESSLSNVAVQPIPPPANPPPAVASVSSDSLKWSAEQRSLTES